MMPQSPPVDVNDDVPRSRAGRAPGPPYNLPMGSDGLVGVILAAPRTAG